MAVVRTFLMIGAAVFTGLTLTTVAGRSQSAGAPLSLTPLAYSSQSLHRRTARKSSHPAQRPARTRSLAHAGPDRNIIVVPSGASVTSLLPWWRADQLQTVRYRERTDESQVLSAADAWFAALGVEETVAAGNDYALASPDELNEIDLAASGMPVADSSEVNAIDLAANDAPSDRPKSWLGALLASLGGALAVASTVRFLFV